MSLPRVIGVLFCVLVVALQAVALDAKQVFGVLEPSTVIIKSLDSEGSGVVITPGGLVVTNYHVVAANIDLKMRARIRKNGRIEQVEIEDVKLVKVHPTYDLALLQATPPRGSTFISANLLKKGSEISPGLRCYAVGNPGGPDGSALETSITEGIVSSASRIVEGKEYLQFSAPINPGNSGGPVSDDHGVVIGIATWKMTQSEGLGFAIPVSKVSFGDFVEPKAKKPDDELVQLAIAQGVNFNFAAGWETGRLRKMLLLAAAECFRIAASADPANPDPLIRLTVMWQKMGNVEVAKKYVTAARRLDPKNAVCYALQGELLLKGNERNDEVVKECIRVWLEGLKVDTDAKRVYTCVEDLYKLLLERKQWAGAAYMLRWADVLAQSSDYNGDADVRVGAWTLIEKSLPKEQLEGLKQKETGFAVDEFRSVSEGRKMIAAAPVKAVPLMAPVLKAPTEEAVAKYSDATASQFVDGVVSVPAEGLPIPLPDSPERALLAFGGWKAVVSLPDLAKLCVLNLATAKVDWFIDIDDRRTLFAAGGYNLVTYSPDSGLITVYDLRTQRKTASVKSPHPTPLSFIGMGLIDNDRVFTVRLEKDGSNMLLVPEYLRLPQMDIFKLDVKSRDGNSPWTHDYSGKEEFFEGGMDEYGNVAAIRKIGGSDVVQFVVANDGTVQQRTMPGSSTSPAVSNRGKYVISRGTLIATTKNSNLYSQFGEGSNPYRSSPVAGFPALVDFFQARDFQGFRLFGLGELVKLRVAPLSTAVSEKLSHAESRDQREVMLASAYCDRIVYVLPEHKTVMLFPLGLKEGQSSAAPRPGTEFTRVLDLPPGSSITIQSGPDGMRYDENLKGLRWTIPANQKTGTTIQIIMLVRAADGKEEYKVEKVVIP